MYIRFVRVCESEPLMIVKFKIRRGGRQSTRQKRERLKKIKKKTIKNSPNHTFPNKIHAQNSAGAEKMSELTYLQSHVGRA